MAITLSLNVWVRGPLVFQSLGEAILPNPPSASDSVDSSTIILLHLEEPLKSHVTPDHSLDDPLIHLSILPQKTSPLDIFVIHPPYFLSEHQFIIF